MKFTMNATSISMGVIIFVLSACESREEKAERNRLEKLYAMDSQEIANAFDRGTLVEPFNSVRKECEKERIDKNSGKWCAKWSEVEDAYHPSFDFSRPKF